MMASGKSISENWETSPRVERKNAMSAVFHSTVKAPANSAVTPCQIDLTQNWSHREGHQTLCPRDKNRSQKVPFGLQQTHNGPDLQYLSVRVPTLHAR